MLSSHDLLGELRQGLVVAGRRRGSRLVSSRLNRYEISTLFGICVANPSLSVARWKGLDAMFVQQEMSARKPTATTTAAVSEVAAALLNQQVRDEI